MQEFNFALSDLTANRAGQLSAGQHELLAAYLQVASRRARWAAGLALGSPIALMALLYLLEGDPGFLRALPFSALAFGLYALILLAALLIDSRRRQALSRAEVRSIQGRPALSQKRHRRLTAYYMTIEGVSLQLQPEQFKAISPNASYRVYYLEYPPSHWLLSLEKR